MESFSSIRHKANCGDGPCAKPWHAPAFYVMNESRTSSLQRNGKALARVRSAVCSFIPFLFSTECCIFRVWVALLASEIGKQRDEKYFFANLR